jgi:hypothetical protein|tara:strand:- start:269 stop:499 length:231 start_codon:yes stop_codon:yes gene_type:complete
VVLPAFPYVPASHSPSHAVEPAALWVPAVQAMHALASSRVPAEQSLQDDDPVADTLPPSQGVHDAAPSSENVAAAQ